MFKPFARYCPTCNFVFRMKRPGQFTECPCGNAVDAGDGFISRTIGKVSTYASEAQMRIALYTPECEAAALWFKEGKDLGEFRDIHTEVCNLINASGGGVTRQRAKAIMYGFLYTEER